MMSRRLLAIANSLWLSGLLLFCTPSFAGELPPDAQAALQKARSELTANREALLESNLDMTPAEAKKFWPLYREFARRRAVLGDARIGMVVDYAEAYPQVDDALAKQLVARSLRSDRDWADLQQRYAARIGKVLPPTKLMRFLQVERRIDNLIELQLQALVPVVDLPSN